ncbi:hypothetical protein MVEN_01080800 [Mycena venus]|uniref:Uncharacterized protein n=1 Tax=Mycena venus TaxID=2733690 RepID=A0A8H6Y9B6_9AGAR|nr:hypothetical protein MVEN_01080800 [Mycena venus]
MPAMASSLPEEIISEILSLVLDVPDAMFSDTSVTSPFVPGSSQVSASTILVVSKTWLRVATPLLYKTVVIRSKPQASALATAFKGQQNLGRYVKKLRLEGGFGKYMHPILKRSPNITDLFLSVQMWASDNVSGLVLDGLRNNCITRLFFAVAECIEKKWANLTILEISRVPSYGLEREQLRDAICASNTLEKLSLILQPHSSDYPYINEMADIPSLTTIEIHDKPRRKGWRGDFDIDDERATPRLRSLIRVTPEPSVQESIPVIPPPVNPNSGFRPMSSAPQSVVDLVWNHVFSFAMFAVEEKAPGKSSSWPERKNSDRLNILLVSTTFKRLALPYLYGYPIFLDDTKSGLLSDKKLQQFSERLCQDPSLGSHVRDLEIHLPPVNRRRKPKPPPDLILISIFRRTPGLQRLIGDGVVSMSWSTFAVLAEAAGQALLEVRGFSIEADGQQKQLYLPTVFDDLQSLQSFTWRTGSVIVSDPVQGSGNQGALPSLRFLHVESSGLLQALSGIALPSLRRVFLGAEVSDSTAFFNIHGPKITRVEMHDDFVITPEGISVFELCPALEHLTLQWTCDKKLKEEEIAPAPALAFPQQHHSLAKLVVQKIVQGKSLTTDMEEWRQFFDAAACEDFPALREVQILYDHFRWPTTEHAISRSLWVKTAERLLEERDIRLTNSEGLHWRPRLKGSRRA